MAHNAIFHQGLHCLEMMKTVFKERNTYFTEL